MLEIAFSPTLRRGGHSNRTTHRPSKASLVSSGMKAPVHHACIVIVLFPTRNVTLIKISGNSCISDEADVIEIERPRDYIVIDPCDNDREKWKRLAISNSPSEGDDDNEEEERTNLIQDARQKGGRVDASGLFHSQTRLAKGAKPFVLVLQFPGITV